jgi:hypothetical protein
MSIILDTNNIQNYSEINDGKNVKLQKAITGIKGQIVGFDENGNMIA